MADGNPNNPQLNIDAPRFKTAYKYEARIELSAKIRAQYPDRYPVIVEPDPRARKPLAITTNRFLAPGDIRWSRFMLEVREKIKIGRQAPLAFTVEAGQMVSGDTLMSNLYERFKDPDGLLYILFSGEV
jgi:GABA(A) receptor-associated protein